MTQRGLAETLRVKLGFQDQPEQRVTRLQPSERVKRRRLSRGSIRLAPPDFLLQRPSFLHFHFREARVHDEQIQKVQDETGLDYRLQKDLAECRLDRDVARLFFYCHRFAEITKDYGTVSQACDYMDLAKEGLGSPEMGNFWTAKRQRYRPQLRKLRNQIERHKGVANDGEAAKCIEDFLAYLRDTWAVG